jgi:hypothetical protein
VEVKEIEGKTHDPARRLMNGRAQSKSEMPFSPSTMTAPSIDAAPAINAALQGSLPAESTTGDSLWSSPCHVGRVKGRWGWGNDLVASDLDMDREKIWLQDLNPPRG